MPLYHVYRAYQYALRSTRHNATDRTAAVIRVFIADYASALWQLSIASFGDRQLTDLQEHSLVANVESKAAVYDWDQIDDWWSLPSESMISRAHVAFTSANMECADNRPGRYHKRH